MTALAEQTGAWLASFTNQLPAPEWLRPLREAGFARFAELGFPTTHDEEWRFTNVARIARATFEPARRGVVQEQPPADGIQLYFMNGHLISRPEKLPKGLHVGGFADEPAAIQRHLGKYASFDHAAFVALNTAFLRDGALVRVDRGAAIEEPVEIIHGVTAFRTHRRHGRPLRRRLDGCPTAG